MKCFYSFTYYLMADVPILIGRIFRDFPCFCPDISSRLRWLGRSRINCKIFSKILESAEDRCRCTLYTKVFQAVVGTIDCSLWDLRIDLKVVTMSDQIRVARVLAALLISMTTGAIVLMAMGNNPPSAGPFCLSSYLRLDPVEKAIRSWAARSPDRWNRIEIYYSGTQAGNIEQLASLNGLASPEDLNCHFVICNGFGGGDGLIQPTEKWQRQWSSIPSRTWYGTSQTIRICVIADPLRANHSTDCQVKRIEVLVEELCRKFDIAPKSVFYPGDWQ